MNAGAGDNLPKKIFLQSIAPQLEFSEKFRKMIADGSVADPSGRVSYRVNLDRFDSFFDSLCHALYFDRYGTPLDPSQHGISHEYLSLHTEDPLLILRRDMLNSSLKFFFENSEWMVKNYEADKLSEVIYQNKMIDPPGPGLGSITIAHTFYSIFNVVSLLTRKPPKQN
jgi:hypothetical protein